MSPSVSRTSFYLQFVMITGMLLADSPASANADRKYGVHTALEYSFGIPTDADLDAHIAELVELGVQVARVGANWWQIEPGATQPTKTEWDRLDNIVDRLHANNIEPLVLILGSPQWANGTASSVDQHQFYVPNLENDPTAFNTWILAYQGFVRRLVERYKDRNGVGVHHWELWNEPNIYNFWKPQPDAPAYATWAAAIADVIKSVDETAKVAMGSLTVLNHAFRSDQIPGKDFLQALYDEGVFPEILSIHPYSHHHGPDVYESDSNRNIFQDVETIREVMLANCQAQSEIWITEMGWAIGTQELSLDEAGQAMYLERALAIVHNRWPYVTRFIWFWDKERQQNGVSHVSNPFALIRLDGTVRPSGERFQEFVQTRGGAPEVVAVTFDGVDLKIRGRRISTSPAVDLRQNHPSWSQLTQASGTSLTRSTQDGYDVISLMLEESEQSLLLSEGLRIGIINETELIADDLTSSNYHTLQPAPLPGITNAGDGCQDGYCIWIAGNNLLDEQSSFVDVAQTDGTFLKSYACYARLPTSYGFNIVLDDQHQKHQFREGFELHVINDSNIEHRSDQFPTTRHPLTDPSLAPEITGAGTGCNDRYCLWIAGDQFGLDNNMNACPVDDCYVDITRTDGSFLATYSGSALNLTEFGFTLAIDDPAIRHYLREESLEVHVVNDQQNHPITGSGKDTWPSISRPALIDPALFPDIQNAGTGCDNRYCLWIAGDNFGEGQCPVDSCYVDITRQDKTFLGTYSGVFLSPTENGIYLEITDPMQQHYLREEGLRVLVVNDQTDMFLNAGSKSDAFLLGPRPALDNSFQPDILNAGTGCEDHYCLWISGTGFSTGEVTRVVITRNDLAQTYLGSYTGEDLSLEVGPDGIETIEIRIVDHDQRYYLRNEGLRVVVVNDVVSDFMTAGSRSASEVVLGRPDPE